MRVVPRRKSYMHATLIEWLKNKKEFVQSVRVHVDEDCTHSHGQSSASMNRPSPIGIRIRMRKNKLD